MPVVISGATGCALSDVRTELKSRTSSELTSARVDTAINDAYFEINERAEWPWLETTTSGTAPLTISDLGQILSVVDSTTDTELEGRDVRDITSWNVDLDTTGNPTNFWLDGMTTLRVWPLNTTDTISVRYLKTVNALTADTDTTVFPGRVCSVLRDLAQLKIQSEFFDNPDLAAAQEARVERRLQQLEATYLGRNYANADYVVTTDWGD
jgi:hypothetical protein